MYLLSKQAMRLQNTKLILEQCCGSETIFSDSDLICLVITDPDQTFQVISDPELGTDNQYLVEISLRVIQCYTLEDEMYH